MPHEPSHFERPKNWPLIILITVGVIILISVIAYFLIGFGKRGDSTQENNQGIAVGEPNPNDGRPQEAIDMFSPDSVPGCGEDFYNCDDFKTQAGAQYVYDYCAKEAGDVHQLDSDGDGVVCEGLG